MILKFGTKVIIPKTTKKIILKVILKKHLETMPDIKNHL